MKIEFSIPGIPVTKGRARHTNRGFAYTPAKTREAENDFISLARQYLPEKINSEHPVQLDLRFFFRIPSSYPKWKQYIMSGDCWQHTTTPDLDNVTKLVMDAMTKLGFWKDDRYVNAVTAGKFYSPNPRTEVQVTYDPIMTRKGLIQF